MELQNNTVLEEKDLDEYFRKRPGTTNWDVDYEILFIANLALNLTIDDNILDFKISTNVKEFGDFDDVVFQASTRDGQTESFALQLKHQTNEGVIGESHLQAATEDFDVLDVLRYFESYSLVQDKHNYKFALFTNAPVRTPRGPFPISFNGEDKFIEIIAANPAQSSILNIDHNCFQFRSVENGVDQIFDRFIFFTNQPNVHQLRHSSFRLYKNHFSSSYDHFHLYIHFIDQWKNLEEPNFLTKYSVSLMIALQILTPDLNSFCQNIDNDDDNFKYNLIKRLTNQFNIVITKNNSLPFLHKCVTRFEIENEEIKLSQIRRRYPIIEPSRAFKEIEDPISKAKLLWLLGKQPLIVKGNPTSYNAIKLCQGKKFLVLDDSFLIENYDFPRLSMFCNLSNLSNNLDLFNKIVENFKTREGSLNKLLQTHPEIRDAITLYELIIMAESVVEAYEAPEALPPAYQERTLTRNIINFNFLEEQVNSNKILVIGCIEQLESIENTLGNFDFLDIQQILENLDKTRITERTIFTSKEKCLPEHLDALIAFLDKPLCHYLEISDQRLEWIYSTAPIAELQDFQNFSYTIQQNDVRHYKNEIILIFGRTGLGTSTLCKSLKNNLYSSLWKTIIEPECFITFLRKSGNIKVQVNLFLDTITERYNPLQKVVFNVLRAKKNLVLFWDKFDQLMKSQTKNSSIAMVKALAESGVKQYVIVKPTHIQFLEEQFSVLSKSLTPFTVAESEQYIRDQLPYLNKTVLRKVSRMIQLNQSSNVFKVPLNLSILVGTMQGKEGDRMQKSEEEYLKIVQNFLMLKL